MVLIILFLLASVLWLCERAATGFLAG